VARVQVKVQGGLVNKPAVIFGVTTLLFASSTLYLSRQLHIEQQRVTANARGAPALPPPASLAQPEVALLPSSSSQASKPEHEPGSEEFVRLKLEGERTLNGNRYLSILENPESRASAVKATKGNLRTSYTGLQQFLGLSAEETDRLLDLLAEQMTAGSAASLRCQFTKGCDLRTQGDPDELLRKRQIEDLLGAEKSERFQTYQQTLMQRGEVNRFREQLPAEHSMSDEQREQLIAALAEERSRLMAEVDRQGAALEGVGLVGGMLYYPSTDTTTEQRFESASRFSMSVRERAAQILSKPQTVIFNQMQDDGLAGIRSYLLQHDAEVAATSSNHGH